MTIFILHLSLSNADSVNDLSNQPIEIRQVEIVADVTETATDIAGD